MHDSGPTANDDFASTNRNTPLTVNILSNDAPGGSDDDDDDDDDNNIDPATVDLNPDLEGINKDVTSASGAFSVNASGDLTYAPATEFTGLAEVRYRIHDFDGDLSNVAHVRVTVGMANEAPVITGQTPDPMTTAQDQPFQIQLGNLIVNDPDNTYPDDFTLEIRPGDHYSVSGLSVTPEAGYMGNLTVGIRVSDGTTTSSFFDFMVSVVEVNPVPRITGQTPDPLTVNEDESIAVGLENLLVTDDDTPYPGGFTITVHGGSNYSVSGNLVSPSLNFSGPLSVPVTVHDGQNGSDPFNASVEVVAVNDPPVITGQSPLTTAEGQPIDIVFSNLQVEDPDNSYPDGFTLSLISGDAYAVSGNRITPNAGFNGTLSVGVIVNDGVSNSAVYNLAITVTAVNSAPAITGQQPVSTDEDTPVALTLNDLIVSDNDNNYPEGFTLVVLPGESYSVSGTTITPGTNFNGVLAVNVKVNDGLADSDPYALQLNVSPVNDPPQITGQTPLSIAEGQSLTVSFDHLQVIDPDNTYPSAFSITVLPGETYTLSGATVTPSAGFTGTLTVAVVVSDGSLNSNIHDLAIQVLPVNNPPVITGQVPVSVGEDAPFTIGLGHLTVEDTDDDYPTGFSLKVFDGVNYTLGGNTVTPLSNFSGTLNIPVVVNDGEDDSPTFTFQIQVGNANDPPVITGQDVLRTREEQPIALALSHVTVVDPDNAFPVGFSLLVATGENYAVSDNIVTPDVNFHGTLLVAVRVSDGVNNSPTFDLQITVDPVNDPPFFDPIADLVVAENSGERTISISNVSPGPGEGNQTLTFVARSGNTTVMPNPTVAYNGAGPTAALTFAPNTSANGLVTVTVTAVDSGPSASPHSNTYSWSFSVTVAEVNDPPAFDPIADVTMAEDAAQVVVALTGISAGRNEQQTLTMSATTTKPELFEILSVQYTSPQTTGQLLLKPTPNAFGTANIAVTLTDNGPATGGSNSMTRTFTCSVQPVNDIPRFVSTPVTLAAVGERYEYVVQIADAESKALPISLAVAPPWMAISKKSGSSAHIRGTPPASSAGPVAVRIQVDDGGLIADQGFTLTVNTRPEVSGITHATNEDEALVPGNNAFSAHFADSDGDVLKAIRMVVMPMNGSLRVDERVLTEGDSVLAGDLDRLTYQANADYWGNDIFEWQGSDGYHYSSNTGAFSISIHPVNDPPRISIERDTLHYEVTGEPAVLTEALRVTDPDDDSLMRADLTIRMEHFEPEWDRLLFTSTGNIRGTYDFHLGRLSLTGKATTAEYVDAIQAVRYNYINTVDPLPGVKLIAFTAHDGESSSEAVDRIVSLEHTFVDLEIPSGFTPNGDRANDTWVITRPGGLDQLEDAVIRVFDHRGVEVHRARGFQNPWDGRFNGEFLPAGSYFFTIDLRLRSKKIYNGLVTILR